jgi:[ribosomal protein S5]-alanine N-acetyltransferase
MLSNDQVILETNRLRLVQCTVRQLEKLIEGPNAFTAAFGHRVVDDYRGFSLAKLTEPSADADWWAPFLFIRREEGGMIGMGRFKGPPDSAGVVEFGYGIAPSCRGQGLATEAAAVLVQHLFGTGRLTVACAHTLPAPSASTRVLEKCGFRHVEDVVDPEDGPVWRWERSK